MASKDLHGCVWILAKSIIASLGHCHRAMWSPDLSYSGGFWHIFSLCLLTVVSTLANLFLGNFKSSSVTSKFSWKVGWLWLNYVYTFISMHISVIDSINSHLNHKETFSHNLYWYFVSGNLDFGMEKSWNFFLRFLWEPWFNQDRCWYNINIQISDTFLFFIPFWYLW